MGEVCRAGVRNWKDGWSEVPALLLLGWEAQETDVHKACDSNNRRRGRAYQAAAAQAAKEEQGKEMLEQEAMTASASSGQTAEAAPPPAKVARITQAADSQ